MPPGRLNYMEWVTSHDEMWGFSNEHSTENLLHYALALCEEVCEVSEEFSVQEPWLPESPGGKREELVDCIIYVQKMMLQLDIKPYMIHETIVLPRKKGVTPGDDVDHLIMVVGRIAGYIKKYVRALSSDNAALNSEGNLRLLKQRVTQLLAIFIDDVGHLNWWASSNEISVAGPEGLFDVSWVKKFGELHRRWSKDNYSCAVEGCVGSV